MNKAGEIDESEMRLIRPYHFHSEYIVAKYFSANIKPYSVLRSFN